MRKNSFFTPIWIGLALIVLLPKLGLATLAFSNGNGEKHFIPVNAKQVAVYSFTITAQTDNESLTRVTVQNIGAGVVKFGSGVTNVSICLDANNDGILSSEEAQTPLGSKVADADTLAITVASPIANGNAKHYFVVYDLDTTAAIAGIGNTTLKADGLFDASGTAVGLGGVQSSNFTVTGFSLASATSLAPAIVVPNQLAVAMLRLDIRATGENVSKIAIAVSNESANFVDKNNTKDGVVGASLYLDTDSNGAFDASVDTLLQTLDGTKLTSRDTLNFSFTQFQNPLALDLTAGNSKSVFVVYDLGENFTVTKDAAVSAKVTAITATGASSQLPVSLQVPTPVTPAKALVCGLSIGSLVGLNTNTNFGAGASAGIMKMKLRAQNGAVKLNQITLQNSGNVKYVTDSLSNNGIIRINVYDDNFNNEVLDPEKGDRLIGTLRLGNGGGQTDTQAPVTIVVPGTTAGLSIPTFNSTIDNSTTIFLEYVVGPDVKAVKDVSGNATSRATAEIVLASGISDASSAVVKLTGVLPASATPSATLSIADTNLIADQFSILAPANSFTGQVKVPMLGFTLTASREITSANIRVRNTNSSLSSFGQGVTKIWLYEDSGDTAGVLDSKDKFLAATSQFQSGSLASLGPIMIPQKSVRYILLYDLGLISSSSGAAAQIDDIVPTDNGTTITFIGQKPLPTSPATSIINTLALTIPAVAVSTSKVTEKTTSLGVEVGVKNDSARNLTITKASPRFFKNNANGQDITYSFAITPLDTYPITLAAGTSTTLSFNVASDFLTFDGTMSVDAALTAKVDAVTSIDVQRFQTSASTWQSGATSIAQLTSQSATQAFDWNLPGLIDSMSIQSGSTDIPFQNRDAIPAHSILKIKVAESGNGIDPSTLVLFKKDRSGSKQMILNTDYTYTVETGLITIQDVGDANVIFAVGASDRIHNPIPVANLWVTISNLLKISEFYTFPSPYIPNGGNMTFGFNATQTGSGVIGIYNSRGQKVMEKSFDIPTIGYQKVTWNGIQSDGNVIFSGIYFINLTATDSNGNKTYANTRLAVY